MEKLIQLRNLVKSYETEAGTFTVLKGLNLEIGTGEFVGVIGKSGSGKSTLINMITGIDRPTSGEVFVADTPIHSLNENQVAQWRGKHLGIVFQFFQLLPNLSVIDNVMLPMDFCNMYTQTERVKRATYLLDLVELEGQYYKLPSQLSGGQQQRVAIARALANDPPILFADEPTGNLDSRTSEKIFTLFRNLVKDGKTILMVTHDEDQAKRVNRTIIISDGEIIEEYLAKTFPALTERQLVWMTSKLKLKTYHQGDTILEKGVKVEDLHIVTKGKVEVVIQPPGMNDMVVAQFSKGQYFGEIELLRKSHSIASIRAAIGENVRIASLSQEDFDNLLLQSTKTKRQIGKVAEERLQEHLTSEKIHV